MAESNIVEPETFGQNVPMYSENRVFRNDLNVSTEDERPNCKKVVYSIIIVCFSIFFFGFCQSFSDFFIASFNERLMIINNLSFIDDMKDDQMMSITDNPMGNQMIGTMDNPIDKHNLSHMNDSMGNDITMETIFSLTKKEESWFQSIIFLGALFGNIVISSFHINRKMVIMNNNFVYLFGVIVMYYSTYSTSLIIGRFILGVASGISFAYVPAYLTELKIYRLSGLIGSFPSMFFTLGLELGYLLEIYLKNHRTWGFILICIFMLAHSMSLIFVLDTKSTINGKNIKSLFENRDSWKSVITCCIFHLAQQASGVNVILICAPILLKDTNSSKNSPVFVGLSQFLATLVAMSFVDKFGRKPLMIISVTGVIISLSIITFSYFIEIGMYLSMIFFSFGLGPITWFITGEVVPLEYRNATNQIATSINWLSAFIAVLTQDYLFSALGTSMFTIYLSFMCIYLIYLIVFFKETKQISPDFL